MVLQYCCILLRNNTYLFFQVPLPGCGVLAGVMVFFMKHVCLWCHPIFVACVCVYVMSHAYVCILVCFFGAVAVVPGELVPTNVEGKRPVVGRGARRQGPRRAGNQGHEAISAQVTHTGLYMM